MSRDSRMLAGILLVVIPSVIASDRTSSFSLLSGIQRRQVRTAPPDVAHEAPTKAANDRQTVLSNFMRGLV